MLVYRRAGERKRGRSRVASRCETLRDETARPLSRSRSKLSVSAGSQKRTIHEPEGRDETRFELKVKRNLDVTIVKYILSLLGQIVSSLGQTNCVGLRTLCPRRLRV